jgi:hypothetical protein
MDTILATVTGLSLALAGVMGVLLVRMARAERRRSDARVALLEQLAATATVQHGRRPASRSLGEGGFNTGHGATPATVQHGATLLHSAHSVRRSQIPAPASRPPAAVTLDDFELRPGSSSERELEHEIFHEHEPASPWPRRFVIVGGMAAVLAAVFFGWTATQPAPAVPVDQGVAQAGEPSLELLSLQHAQEDGTLTISGLVQNPRDARALAGVHATVQLFGADGRTVASGRAPIDFTTLAPGDESPFVIRVLVSGAVVRYRVGFRGENDRVLGHIDRRNLEAVARKQEP